MSNSGAFRPPPPKPPPREGKHAPSNSEGSIQPENISLSPNTTPDGRKHIPPPRPPPRPQPVDTDAATTQDEKSILVTETKPNPANPLSPTTADMVKKMGVAGKLIKPTAKQSPASNSNSNSQESVSPAKSPVAVAIAATPTPPVSSQPAIALTTSSGDFSSNPSPAVSGSTISVPKVVVAKTSPASPHNSHHTLMSSIGSSMDLSENSVASGKPVSQPPVASHVVVSNGGFLLEPADGQDPNELRPRISLRNETQIYAKVDDLYKLMICIAAGDIGGLEQEMETDMYLHQRSFENEIPLSFVAAVNNRQHILLRLFQSGDLNENYKTRVKTKWRVAKIHNRQQKFWLPDDMAFERRGIKWKDTTKTVEAGVDLKNCAAKFGIRFEDDVAAWCRGSLSVDAHIRTSCRGLWDFLETVNKDCDGKEFFDEFQKRSAEINEQFRNVIDARSVISTAFKQRIDMEYPLTLQLILEISDAMDSYNVPELPAERELLTLEHQSCLQLVDAGSSFQEILSDIKKSREESVVVQQRLQHLIEMISHVEEDYRKWTIISEHRRHGKVLQTLEEKSDAPDISMDHIARATRVLTIAKNQWENYQKVKAARLEMMEKLRLLMIEELDAMNDFARALNTGFDAWDDCADAAAYTSGKMKSLFHPKQIEAALSIVKRKKKELDAIHVQNQLYERFLLEIDIRARAIFDLDARLQTAEEGIKKEKDQTTVSANYHKKMKKNIQRSLNKANRNLRSLTRNFLSANVQKDEDRELLKACLSARFGSKYEDIYYRGGIWIEEMMEDADLPEAEESHPLEFLCPITKKLMSDPVIYSVDGKTYEKKALMQLIITKEREVKSDAIQPNRALSIKISEYNTCMQLMSGASEWWQEEKYIIPES
jgi:hypothetical protein